MGLFKHDFYNEHIKNSIMDINAVEEDLSPVVIDDYFSDDYAESDPSNSLRLYYISDIHLMHKLKNKFSRPKSDKSIIAYIEQLAEEMVESATQGQSSDYLLIAGDVSFDFSVSEIFFRKLTKLWRAKNIVVVLGNHELWDKSNNLDYIIKKYRDLFSELDITFLHNDLLFVRRFGFSKKLSESELLKMSEQELAEAFLEKGFAVLGGLGFSGLNENFNATKGVYRGTISSLEQDKAETAKFETVYKKVLSSVPNDKVVVFTHTPKENWTYEDYNSNWIYVNGHTHQDLCYRTESKTIYANNQVGYKSSNLSLKYFTLSTKYNIYRYLPDGIHIITDAKNYELFYAGNGTDMRFRRKHKELYLVKKNGVYAFFCTFDNKPNLYILDGGMPHKLDNSDINYYYENIDVYAHILKKPYKKYYEKLQELSKFVQSFGGDGAVHGCIVDIDFYNHIYLNPFDGKITPYYAPYSIIDKYVYNTIPALLSSNCKQLYSNYKKMIAVGGSSDVIVKELEKGIIKIPQYVSETDIYKPSRAMRKMQYLQELNVIRNWDDNLIKKYKYKTLDA